EGRHGRVAEGLSGRQGAEVILAAGAAAGELSVPLPHGWIGTTSEWMTGFGIGLVVLNLILLLFAWYRMRGADQGPSVWGWLLVAGGPRALPGGFVTFSHGLESSATVSSVGSCHTTNPLLPCLPDAKSATPAPPHLH